jgi:hypothetical protein
VAKQPANVVRAYLDEINISGKISAFGLDLSQETPVVTCLSDDGPRRVVGNYDHKASFSGFFDGDDDEFDEQAFVNFRTDEDHYLSTLFGTSEGVLSYQDVCRLVSQPRSGAVGGAIMLNLEAEGSGVRTRGVVLRNATVTGTGNGTGRNMGATLSGTLLAVHFHLIALTGTDIALKLQESSDDGGGDAYADITGLASGTLTGAGVVRKTTTAATEAYKRVVISSPSGFTSATIVVTAGS